MAEEQATMEETAIPIDPKDVEIADLKEKLKVSEQKRDEALRALSSYEESRKRAERDLQTERKYAHSKFANDLLGALDNLDRAIEAAKKASDSGSLVQGVMITQTQILDVLKRYGITPIEALGQPFNPHYHEAVSRIATNLQPPDTIVEVLQKGFLIHDRILRPATVIVAVANETK